MAVAALSVALAMLALDVGLRMMSGDVEPALRRAEVLDPGEYERVGRQIAAAERDVASPGASFRRVIIVAGLSTAREDIDGDAVGRALCGGSRLLNLGSSGGSFRELAFYLRPLRSTALSSALTVLAVHPVWLAGRRNVPEVTPNSRDSRGENPVSGNLRRDQLKSALWSVANRRAVHAVVMDALWSFRERVDRRFALTAQQAFEPERESPWADRISYQGMRAGSMALDEQLRAWQAFGWFDARRFDSHGSEADALVEVLSAGRSAGGRVVVVLMPEHSTMRRMVPDVAGESLRTVVERAGPYPILDLSAAIPDNGFYDYAHLNARGRGRLSALLARRLADFADCTGSPREPRDRGSMSTRS